MKLICPVCEEKLTAEKLGRGMAWSCGNCEGKAVNLTILKNLSDSQAISEFWMAVRHCMETDNRKCPSCRKSMRVYTASELGGIEVDVCITCQFLWFDHKELEQVPRATRQQIEDYNIPNRHPSASSELKDPFDLSFPSTKHRSLLHSIFSFFFWI